jgi:hypothetical protein
MSSYVKFTQEEIDRAAHTEIKSILEAKGEKVIRSGSEWAWKEHDSVKIRDHVFYQHSNGEKGTAIDFMCLFFKMSFQDAVSTLICKEYDGVDFVRAESKPKERLVFRLPGKSRNMRRAYAYLMQERCIDSDIISFFVHNRSLYESCNTHNVVFVGYDSAGNAKAAHERGTLTERPYRSDVTGSEKGYFFNYHGNSNRVYVFEAPIDMLSFISLYKEKEWQHHNYIALGGVAVRALLRFLLEHPQITQVVLCLDNDETGQKADLQIKDTLERIRAGLFIKDLSSSLHEQLRREYEVSVLKSKLKDWNDDIKKLKLNSSSCG